MDGCRQGLEAPGWRAPEEPSAACRLHTASWHSRACAQAVAASSRHAAARVFSIAMMDAMRYTLAKDGKIVYFVGASRLGELRELQRCCNSEAAVHYLL